jgi:hypothetical protein
MDTPSSAVPASTTTSASPQLQQRTIHSTPAPGSDYLLGGTWQCMTFGGNKLAHTFSRDDDGTSIVGETLVFLTGGRQATLHEDYRHHTKTGLWTASLAGGTFKATAPEWTANSWTFTGNAIDGGKRFPVAMIFTELGHDAFRRDFQRNLGNGLQTYAGETCERTSS